ncbi:MAG TPA: TetR/AcrR family transcriptional regulator [Solirubrobacteraceae bacterium]|nr:TetR/AcrR family transcriptional regulator [Solirubrobacteraceae bacterium]
MSTAAPVSTRERLLAAARAVIEEDGYAGAAVLQVAERAGVAAGTLYRHFDSKQDLFVEVFRAVCSREERAMLAAGEALGSDAAVVARLEEVLATFARRALRNPRLAWALLAEPVDPRVDVERLAHRARYTRFVAESLRGAIAAGEIPPLDVEFTAAAVVGGCGAALVGPLAPSGSAPAQEAVVSALRAFVRRAVGAAPGPGTAPATGPAAPGPSPAGGSR